MECMDVRIYKEFLGIYLLCIEVLRTEEFIMKSASTFWQRKITLRLSSDFLCTSFILGKEHLEIIFQTSSRVLYKHAVAFSSICISVRRLWYLDFSIQTYLLLSKNGSLSILIVAFSLYSAGFGSSFGMICFW